ncbi:hypothetical protein ACVK1X_001863 [Pseudomonas sp. PvR086]|jgi:hypothetical protein|uniref:Lipoprotein n=1 Tax=Pseudomonas frederiksbergensis TaxID=104087 RepID=A0AB33E817_9PSED|nr:MULTISPECIES: hypothetical protein [Pseudomonas]ANI62931.1 hypothetical protein PGR6_53580 [Pseudomonas sp. GR 6-02]ATE75307.1 hypothetical protein CNN82_02350 [Pseudomonas frederiksbergensis]MBD9605798.1 hypothetical protein [Pseudomonas sp. PDM08]MBD9618354.1 hypothetical protein [Pseudomonas sp. PDM07]MDR7106926.1 hypothetical protein [Pseudomonas frederiksbergensis]
MVRTLMLLIAAGMLAACGSNPKATPEPAPSASDKGCYQADWQAETNPVINKRSGPDGLDKYETQTPTKEHGCP